jgi:SAM-dependent methyltransferase
VEILDASSFLNPVYWHDAWEKVIARDQRHDSNQEAINTWNRRAKNFDSNVGSGLGQKRVLEVLDFLKAYGILAGKLKIIDIGCGPGNFSLALAQLGHTVWALDPAAKMLDLLEKKLDENPELKSRVNPVQADWITLDLSEYGWERHFDLVFASMTPGISNVSTLEKALRASKEYVYLSRFAGQRIHASVQAIWSQLYGTAYYHNSQDIFYPLNWLYASGYRPVLHYSHWERNHSQRVDEAIAEIMNMLSLRVDITKHVESVIRSYVEERAVNGLFAERKGATAAMLLWHVGKQVIQLSGGLSCQLQ